MFNLTKPLLQDTRSGFGKIDEVGRLMSPLDLYISAIAENDGACSLAQEMQIGEPMALARTSYVVNQPSWKTLISDAAPGGMRALLLDWETKTGPRSAQACFMTPAGKIRDKSMLSRFRWPSTTTTMALSPKHFLKPNQRRVELITTCGGFTLNLPWRHAA
jgi:hypothetical protein